MQGLKATPAVPRGDRHGRAHVWRAACLAALALFLVLTAAAAISPGAARAATYNTWTKQTSGTTSTLYGINFINASNGWLVGAAGTTRYTTNGGTTWTKQTSNTTSTLQSVFFTDANNGWSVGAGGVVLHTTNGGTTWTAQTSGVTTTLYGVGFTDANTGWSVGAGGVVLHTTNGGTTWTKQTSGVTTTLEAVSFVNSTTGWAVGASGVVLHTTNGGTTWTKQTSGVNRTLYGVYFTDVNNGWAAGNRGYVRHTTNGGTAWTAQTSGVTVTLYGVRFIDVNNGWVVGATSTKVPHTTNGGTAWSNQTSPSTQTQRAITSAAGNLWTCGNGGVVLNYLVDTTPPVTTATGLQAANNTGWRATSQSVTLSATDGQSGVKATYYTIDGGAQQTYTAPFAVSASGSHTIVYWSVDVAGNTEAQHTGYVNIDATAPATTATGLQANNHTGWATTSQTVTLSATDVQSGVTTTYYTIDGGAQQLYAGPFLVGGNGTHTVTYWSVDAAGNIEATHTGFVNIDTTAPVTTASGLQTDNHTVWQNVSQVVSLAGSDPLSGVAVTYYTLDSVTRQTYTTPFTVSGQGVHTVTYWSVDAVGNVEATHSGYVNIDTTAPTVTSDADGAWHRTAVTVHLTPADTGGSGLAGTQYRLQGASTWTVAAGNAFVVPAPPDGSGDGMHVYQYQALDNAGNVSSTGSCTVWIDASAPTTTATGLAPDQFSAWRTTSQTVSLAADDGAGSGVTATYYTVDGGGPQTYSGAFVVSGIGEHPVTYWSTDAAGNVETIHTGWVNISNPWAQATNLAADTHSGWHNAATTVTITGGGDHSPITVSYKVDAGSWTTVSSPASFVVSGEGSHTVLFYATNDVGVQCATQTGYVNIDTTKPVTAASGLQLTGSAGWIASGQSVTLTPSDALSGVAATYYTVDGGAQQLYGGPFLVAGNGSHPVTYWSVDNAGNIEATHSGYVNIDTTAPVTTASGLQLTGNTGWTKTSQAVTLTPSDGLSGVATTHYTVNGGGLQTGTSFTVSAAGSNVIVYWSVDNAGNIEATHSGYVNIDTTAPVTTASGLQLTGNTGWTKTSQAVTLTPSDGLSGVATTHYTVNGGGLQTGTSFTVSAAGSNVIVYWSVDNAGNIEATHSGYVNIDTTAPVTTASGLQLTGNTGWTKTSQAVTLTPSDGLSGVATTHYTVNGGGLQTGTSFTVSAAGSNVIVYWSVDNAGNIEGYNTGYVNIDTTAPVTTASGLQLTGNTGWTKTSQAVTLTPSDGLSGVATTHYTVNGGGLQTGTSFTVSAAGSNVIVYWSVDNAGNIEATHSGYVNIDTTAPTVTDNAGTAWHNTAVTVTLTPADTGGSGVAGTQYRLLGATTWTAAAGNTFVVPAPSNGSGDGANVYQYQALDNAGNASAIGTCTVKIDTQGPVVTPTGLAADQFSAWRTTSQTVTLSANDNGGSGLAAMYYTVDGGATQTYSGGFTVSGTGQHPVVYWATDALGNVTAQKTGWVNISNPWAQATNLAADTHSGWHNAATTATITGGGDNGPFTISYKVDGAATWTTVASPASVTVSTAGNHTVAFYAKNSVGTVSATQTGYLNIDLTAPSTTATGLQANNSSGWVASGTSVPVTLTPTDALSGVAATYYTVNGGAQQLYTGSPFLVGGSGSQAVTYWSVDAAGNIEASHTGYVNIDTSAPVTTATGLAVDDDSGWTTNTAPTVTLSATDAGGPGVATTYYTVDGSDPQVYAGAFTVTDDGQHPVTYWSVDTLGNVEAANTGYVNIDTTAPVTAADSLMPDTSSGWQDSPQTVTLSADDGPGCGVATTYYTVNGGATQTYTTPFTVSAQGSNLITYWSVDALGNTEATNSGYANLDLTAPTVTDNAGTAWHNAAVTVTLTPTDTGGSGVAGTQYRLQGATTWLTASGNAFVVPAPADHSGDGAWTYEYRALDVAGNASATRTCTVNMDTTAPTTTASGLQTDNHSGWRNSSQAVTLTPSDALSGMGTTYYTVNGGVTQTGTSFVVSAAGVNTVVYWSVDAAANIEASHTGYVNIDTSAPTVGSDSDGLWHNSAVTVHLTPADTGGSGLAGTQYRLQGASTWTAAAGNAFVVPAPSNGSGDGTWTYQFEALDNAGNVSSIGSCVVKIDTQGPQTGATGLQADDKSGWQKASQTVGLTPSDAGSGIATTYYTVDGGARQTFTTPFSVSGSGSHRVTYWSVDKVGNVESPHAGYVNIDTTPPVTGATGLAANSSSGWEDTPQLVTLSGEDSLSGLAATYYTIDAGAQQTYQGPFTISADGQHTVTYWSVDAVGNTEATNTGYVNIDLAPPSTTATGLAASAAASWSTVTPRTVTLAATDARSGVLATYYTLDGGGQQTYTGALTISTEGPHTITYWSLDGAGNIEPAHTGYVSIDTTAPTVSDNTDSLWHDSDVTVTLTGADPGGSGIAQTQYRLHGSGTWLAAAANQFVVPAPANGSNDGARTYDYGAIDNVGNASAARSCTVKIDATAPVTVATSSDGLALDGSTWHGGPLTVTLAPSDPLDTFGTCSGVASTQYSTDGGATWTTGTTVTFPVWKHGGGSGAFTLLYRSTDQAGNTESSRSAAVQIDNTPPTTTETGADLAWHSSPVTVTFSATDSGCGVARTEYSTDGGNTWNTGTSVTIPAPSGGSNDGVHPIDYYSVDNLGNTETVRGCTVDIDTQQPVTVDNAGSVWHAVPFTLQLSASDISGTTTTQYSISDDTHWQTGTSVPFTSAWKRGGGSSEVTVYYHSTNGAGVVEAEKSCVVLIDTSRPVTTDDAPLGPQATGVTVRLTGYDTYSGVGQTWYQVDGGVWTEGNVVLVPAPANHSNDGIHTISYYSIDKAGNIEAGIRVCSVVIATH